MTRWLSSYLEARHLTETFDCGRPQLDSWLKEQALRAQESNTARTYVWTMPGDLNVVAYYSIAPTQVLREELTGGQSGGFSVVPAYLLARLALDRTLHGQGLGAELLIDALEVIVRAARSGGGRLIVVDALDDEAAAFYRHHDFQAVKGSHSRLVMKVSTASKSLGVGAVRVTGDRDTQLVSIVAEFPDGTSLPVVVSPAEAEGIAHRIIELADQADVNQDIRIDFFEVLRTVLGRDPLDG